MARSAAESKSFHPFRSHLYYNLLSNDNFICSVCEISQTLVRFFLLFLSDAGKNHYLFLIFYFCLSNQIFNVTRH